MDTNKLNKLGQWTCGSAMLAVAVTAGTVGLLLNVSHGLQTGIAVGVLFGLADVSKILIPIIGGAIGWSRQLRITAAICVAASLFCAIQYYLGSNGQHRAEQQHGAIVYAERAKRIAELEKSVADLDAYAAVEARKGGCGSNCRALTVQAAETRQRLDTTRNERAEAKPVEIIANAGLTSVVQTGLFLVLIEALVWLSVPAMALLGQAMKKQAPVEAAKVVKEARKSRKARAWNQKDSSQLLSATLRTGFRFKKDGTPDRRYRHAKHVVTA